MNIVLLQGTLSSDPVVRTLASGSTLWSLELTTVVDGVNVSVPVAWFDPPASAAQWVAGNALLVSGTVRRRFYRSGGITQSRTEVVATEVVALSRRKQVRAIIARTGAALSTEAA